jgi:hypothetical protein
MKKLTTTTAAPAPMEPWRAAALIPAEREAHAGPAGLLLAVVERARIDARKGYSHEAARFWAMVREAA